MKILGVIFIVLSAGSVGFRIAAALKTRCMMLRKLLSGFHLLEHELSFLATPLPQAFALMATMLEGGYKHIFATVAEKMDKTRWLSPKTAMEQALKEYPDEQIGDVFLEFAGNMGKYDLDMQMKGIEIARSRVERLLGKLEEERCIRSKTYETLSICAGLAAVILLI